jgi:hypothetical protein
VEVVTVARRTGTIALIRPDAYIAWADSRAGDAATAKIRAALPRWSGSPE